MKKKQKGFTLVELLVVIAILAVLATVSILGYSSFTKKANISNDQSIVSQMNLTLQSNEALGEGAKYEHQAIEQCIEAGFILENLTPSTNGYHYAYDQANNRFMLLEEDYSFNYGDANHTDVKAKPWLVYVVVNSQTEINNAKVNGSALSVYLRESYEGSSANVEAGIDVGENTKISSITYTNNKNAQDVVIRTNGIGTDLTIIAPQDTIRHYDTIGNVYVKRAANNSYHEYGIAGFVQCASGRIVAEVGGTIDTVLLTEKGTVTGDPANVSAIVPAVVQTNGGTIKHEYATNNDVVNSNNPQDKADQLELWVNPSNQGNVIAQGVVIAVEVEQAISTKKEEALSGVAEIFGYEVSIFDGTTTTYSTLSQVKTNVNNGVNNYDGCTITLLYDIDLKSIEWEPIGRSEANAFAGNFDGNYKTISNLKITNVNSEGTAFFGYINNNNSAITIKNLEFKDASVDLGSNQGKNVGVAVGYVLKTSKEITINNVDVTGNSVVTGKAHVGGIIGKIYGKKATITNCDNNASVTCAGSYAGGIIAIASDSAQTIEFNNCINNGVVSGSLSGGIVGRTGSKKVDISNCQNKANVTGTAKVGGIVGTAEATIELNIDKDTKNISGNITGTTKGILIGYTYVYNSPENKVTITRDGTSEYADTEGIGLIGEFSVAEVTIKNAKLHNVYLTTSWKNVAKLHFDNCRVDNVTWNTESGEYGTGSEAHANDGEYLYISSINSSVLTTLTYSQKNSFYKNYYSFKGFTTTPTINNANSSPLESVAWYE